MSLAVYFSKSCIEKTKKSIRDALMQLTEPSDMFQVNISGALMDAMKGGLGSTWQYAQDYLKNNADTLAYSVAGPIGKSLGINVNEALNQVFSMFAFTQLAGNTFVLYLMKYTAKNCIRQLDRKLEILGQLREDMIELHNQLKKLTSGESVYDGYLNDLRVALLALVSAKNDLKVVYSSLDRNKIYLSKVYERAKVKVGVAQHRIRPSTGNPFVKPFFEQSAGTATITAGKELLTSVAGLPTSEQIDSMRAIPRISLAIIKGMRDYATTLVLINGLLDAYEAGVDFLMRAITNKLQEFALDSLAKMIQQLNAINSSVAETISYKKNPAYPNDRTKMKRPNPVSVTAMAFKWSAQIAALVAQMKLLPTDALSRMNLGEADLKFYETTVGQLKALDDIKTSKAVLYAEDAKEEIAVFEQQVLLALTATNTAIPSGKVNEQTFALFKSIISRVDLTIGRDNQIKSILQSFVDYRLQGEAEFERIMNQIEDTLQKAGLDKALDLLRTGDFVSFFGLTGTTATYVGAALTAIALLKQCFDTTEEQENITQIERELERDLDLANIKLSFDFTLDIFNNLQYCLRVEGLSDLFSLKEFFCGIVTGKKPGSTFDNLSDSIDTKREDYDSNYKELVKGTPNPAAPSPNATFFKEHAEEFKDAEKEVKLDIIDGFKTWFGMEVAEANIAAQTPNGL